MRFFLAATLGAGVLGSLLFATCRDALAQPPDPALLARIALHAKAFEDLTKRASYTFDATVDKLDSDGKVDDEKKKRARIESDGTTEHQVVIHCTQNGKDTTAEEQERVRKQEADAAKKKKDSGDDEELRMPFLTSEQPNYTFDQIAVDPSDPNRVKISFVPRNPDKHSVEGTAWVDTTTGNVVSAGVKLSKPPMLVDWVHFTVEFGAPTPLGPAASHVTFEGKGGLLFIRKHFRGELTLSDYRIGPAPAAH